MTVGRVLRCCASAVFHKGMRFRFVTIQAAKVIKFPPINLPNQKYLFASLIPSVLVVKALTKKEKTSLIKDADKLYDENKFEELYNILEHRRNEQEPELLWRLARALFEKCRDMNDKDKLIALEEALVLVDEALKLDDNCWAAHKWRAILLDYVWRYKSTKERIVHSFEVKKHMERAIALNPKDSTSHYLLGEWCFTFADMPWYQRKIASAIFASPPTSSYEEALMHFEKAEENDPLFYSMNLLMLAKCQLKLNNQDKAIKYLKLLMDYPAKTADDKQACTEGAKLLKELNVN